VLDGGLKERAHRWLRVTAATPIDEAFHLRHEPNLLKALAEPGGICLSAAAHEQVRDRLVRLRRLSAAAAAILIRQKMPPKRSFAPELGTAARRRADAKLPQHVQQASGRLQICRVEALNKSVEHRSQNRARIFALPLIATKLARSVAVRSSPRACTWCS
jgi:hypothetical protein